QLQDYPAALSAFTKYLAANKGDIPQQRVDDVQRDIERLKTRIGTLRITVNRPGAQILVDDAPIGAAPLSEPVLVGAGRHRVAATADGQTTVPKVVDVAGAETIDVSLALGEPAPKQGPTPEVPVVPRRGGGPIVWVPWAITGGLAVATVASGVVALSNS